MNTDLNLLFGVLALQFEHIDSHQFADVCAAWASRKNTAVADILVEWGWITTEAKEEVERLLQRKLSKHEGDASKALSASADAGVRSVMRDVEDDEVEQTLSRMEPPSGFVKVLDTVDFTPEERSHYTLSRMHSKGGIGQVWLARDRRLNREVALKEPRPDKKLSNQALRRFVQEAQITCQLDHPNVVAVYELGEESAGDRPFYTMPFVDGQTLGGAIDALHRLRREGKATRLDTRRLLNVFISVCQAIAYAHSRGVLHRDVKPANVMLGAFGEVVVLDWGLAKLMDEPDDLDDDQSLVRVTELPNGDMTVQGQVVGTLQYMAPEQAEGRRDKIDARTDIYGLGSTLYRILTGERAHGGASKDDIIKDIIRRPTPRPRQTDPSIPKALDAICSKAMAEKRSDRYKTATELADDVRRWLADEPVLAHDESARERLMRWVRRHRTIALATAATVCLVAVAALTALVLVERARRETHAAKDTAVMWFGNAIDTVESMRIAVSEVLKYYPGAQELRLRLLEEAAKAYERFVAEDPSDPQLRAQLGRIHVRLGDVYRQLERSADAEKAYQAADKILAELEENAGDAVDVSLERTVCLRGLGDACAEQGRYEEAEKEYDRAEAIVRQLTSPADRCYQLAHILLSRALMAERVEDTKRAESLLAEAGTKLKDLLQAKEGDRQKCRETLAMVETVLGQVLVSAGRHDEAIGPLERAREAHRDLHMAEEDHPSHLDGLVSTNINLANALRALGRPDEEHVALKNAIEDSSILLVAMPDVPRFAENHAIAQASLARLLHIEHENEKAKALLDEGIAEFTGLATSPFVFSRYLEELAIAHTIRGQVLRDLGETEAAEADFHNAIRLYERLRDIEPDAPRHARGAAIAIRQRGRLAHSTGDHATAKDDYEIAVASFGDVLKVDATDLQAREGLVTCLEHLGDLMQAMQSPEEANEYYRKALAERVELPGHAFHKFRETVLQLKLGDANEAISIAEELTGKAPDNGHFWTILGAAQLRNGQAGVCISTLEGLADEFRDPARPEFELWLAMAYHTRNSPGDAEKAKKLFDRAVEYMDRQAPGCVELLRLRAQAAQMLGIPNKTIAPTSKPADGASKTKPNGNE